MEERKITLVDDEQTLEFYVLEETKLNGSDYLLVTDAEDEEEEADCYILKDMSRDCLLYTSGLSQLILIFPFDGLQSLGR